ncbi:MAG: phosphoglucomutase/phosphomannomutase family protein [Bacteroidota bacterium]|nr:phosphoglucomutase/phosphomannomutase family protein [Bacteroidota bacterium]
MSDIKFGTDGWRAIIADDYTVKNVIRVAEATAIFMEERAMQKVIIGYDCRFGGKMFAETTARVFGSHQIEVVMGGHVASTPMVSLAVVKLKADLGVVITASHNPPSYNGFKLKSSFGGPSIPDDIAAVESHIPEKPMKDLVSLDYMKGKGLLTYMNLEDMYYDHVVVSFDLEAIKKAGFGIGYDAMYGAGYLIFPRILPEATLLHCDYNPSFYGQAPEPIERNLQPFRDLITSNPNIQIGIANDGDADRIGMLDAEGNFVDSHHILLLLLYYLHKIKGLTGKVVTTFSVTDKMVQLAEKFGLEVEVTKIGFKYIAEIMTKEDVLVGGEESGGLAVKGHIPERDGVWIGLLILEFMAKTGKSLKELIQLVYDEVGTFAFDRDDLHITQEQKEDVLDKCYHDKYTSFGDLTIERTEKLDGFKYYLSNSTWIMIRPSGTEPVLRVYCEAADRITARATLDVVRKELLG